MYGNATAGLCIKDAATPFSKPCQTFCQGYQSRWLIGHTNQWPSWDKQWVTVVAVWPGEGVFWLQHKTINNDGYFIMCFVLLTHTHTHISYHSSAQGCCHLPGSSSSPSTCCTGVVTHIKSKYHILGHPNLHIIGYLSGSQGGGMLCKQWLNFHRMGKC